jgi:hypothetical protein
MRGLRRRSRGSSRSPVRVASAPRRQTRVPPREPNRRPRILPFTQFFTSGRAFRPRDACLLLAGGTDAPNGISHVIGNQ